MAHNPSIGSIDVASARGATALAEMDSSLARALAEAEAEAAQAGLLAQDWSDM